MLQTILILIMPFLLLWWGWCYITKKFPIVKTISQYMISILKWSWKERHIKSGGGKLREPRTMYYDD
jgi:hypothetical protein